MTTRPTGDGGGAEFEVGLRRVGQIIVDERPQCPVCGHAVFVQSEPEGTHYIPDESLVCADAEALLRDALTVQRTGCDHSGIGRPGCRICDPRVREWTL